MFRSFSWKEGIAVESAAASGHPPRRRRAQTGDGRLLRGSGDAADDVAVLEMREDTYIDGTGPPPGGVTMGGIEPDRHAIFLREWSGSYPHWYPHWHKGQVLVIDGKRARVVDVTGPDHNPKLTLEPIQEQRLSGNASRRCCP